MVRRNFYVQNFSYVLQYLWVLFSIHFHEKGYKSESSYEILLAGSAM